MPKNCINCRTPISGDGKNKVFCDDCLQKISPFLKFISQSKVPAVKLYEVNLDRLKAMELSDLTLAYIEKCCVRYDEKRATAATPAPQPKKKTENIPAVIPAVKPETVKETPRSEDIPPKSDEKSDIKEEISVKTADKPKPAVSEYDMEDSSLASISETDATDDGEAYEDDGDGHRRIMLIIAAAITTFLIFFALYMSGIIPGYTPNGADTEAPTDTGNIILPPQNDTSDSVPETEPETEPIETTCPHSWTVPTCTEPAVCSICGETEGEAIGHDYAPATCTLPPICRRCIDIDGDALGHDFTEATCSSPQTCTVCGETNGSALDHNWRYDDGIHDNVCTYCKKSQADVTGVRACEHDWAAASCDTAKTCKNCGETDGKALGHDWKSATCTEVKRCTRCDITEGDPLGHDMKPASCTSPSACSRCELTEGAALGHTLGGVTCPQCGEYLVFLSKIGSAADDKSGLSVTVESIEAAPTENGTIYYVKYTVTNNSADSMLEGAFKLFLEGGGGIDPPGAAYVPVNPGESVSHTYTFEVTGGAKPLILEYYNDGGALIFRNEPHTSDEALYWAVK